ncbi:MAG: peptide chain release factor-like protein [Deltaproteobacteria bacterium]|nr:peptide chain release factor-like protein [Deltaproteobacteria bacterium]
MQRFPVSPAKEAEIKARMEALGIREEDLSESFIRASGKGGQKVNKTSVAVQLCHKPSGIMVRAESGRSQIMNRYYARKRLVEKLEAKALGEKSLLQQKIEKIRRQKRKRSQRAKEKVLAEKKLQSTKKKSRQKPPLED